MIQNDLQYSKKPVIIAGGNDRWIHNNDNEEYRTDDNLEDQKDKYGAQIGTKYVYRVPLKFLRPWQNKFFNKDRVKNQVYTTNGNEKTIRIEKKPKKPGNWCTRRENCICKGSLNSILANLAHKKFQKIS